MSLPKATLFSGLLSLVVNLVILYFAKPLAPGFMTLSIGPVSIWTILGTLGAWITFALIRKWSSNPTRTFLVVAIVVLLLSFIPDILVLHTKNPMFKGANPSAVAVLMLMHIVVAAITVLIFLRVQPKPHHT